MAAEANLHSEIVKKAPVTIETAAHILEIYKGFRSFLYGNRESQVSSLTGPVYVAWLLFNNNNDYSASLKHLLTGSCQETDGRPLREENFSTIHSILSPIYLKAPEKQEVHKTQDTEVKNGTLRDHDDDVYQWSDRKAITKE